MIKSIVFDLGNVLIDFDPMRFVREKRRILKSKKCWCQKSLVQWIGCVMTKGP